MNIRGALGELSPRRRSDGHNVREQNSEYWTFINVAWSIAYEGSGLCFVLTLRFII